MTPRPPIEAWNVRLDETAVWSFPEDLRPYIKRVWSVYLFDRSQAVHLCEITPSYWLAPLYQYAEFNDPPPSDEVRERINDLIDSTEHDDVYYHCHFLEGLIEKGDETRIVYRGRRDLAEDEDRDEVFEEIRERHACNWAL
jgi:hypothetical protein